VVISGGDRTVPVGTAEFESKDSRRVGGGLW
jgi:hypothetical protein